MPSISCTEFDQLLAQKDKFLLVFTQPGCPVCPPYMDAIGKVESRMPDIDVAELPISVGEDPCEDLADRFKVGTTPTAIFFRNGKVEKVLHPTGDSQKDQENLLALARGPQEASSEPQASPAPSESELPRTPSEASPTSPSPAPSPAP